MILLSPDMIERGEGMSGGIQREGYRERDPPSSAPLSSLLSGSHSHHARTYQARGHWGARPGPHALPLRDVRGEAEGPG